MSFIFGGTNGMTYEQMLKQRALAQQLAASGPGRITNTGEGIRSAAGSIAAALVNRRADKAEEKGRSEATAQFNSILGAGMGGYGGAGASGFGGDAYASSRGTNPNYANAISSVESGGDYGALGPVMDKGSYSGDRAYGRYQVMGRNIPEWTRQVLGQEMTPEQFLASPEAQDAVFNAKFGESVEKYGNPQDAASVWFSGRPMSEAGNASDGYTTVPEYVSKFSAALGGGGGQQGGPQPQLAELMQMASNPYLGEGQRQIVSALLSQQMQASDPMRQMQLERGQLELDQMRNPQPQPQYQQVRGADLGLEGEAAGAMFNVAPDGKITQVGGAGTNINVNTGASGPQVGTIPQGYQLEQDPETGALRMAPIPGGPEDTTKFDDQKAQMGATASDVVTTAAARARAAAGERDFGAAGTSVIGKLPWTDSAEVIRQTDVLKSQAAVGNLNAMRAASPTGGALGNVTEKELKLLQDQSGALNPDSPTFLRDLEDYERTLLRTIHGKDAGDRIYEQTRGDGAQRGGPSDDDLLKKYGG